MKLDDDKAQEVMDTFANVLQVMSNSFAEDVAKFGLRKAKAAFALKMEEHEKIVKRTKGEPDDIRNANMLWEAAAMVHVVLVNCGVYHD